MEDRGIEVLDLQDCLAEVLTDDTARAWVLDRKITDNIVGPGVGQELRAWLDALPADDLADYLIGGVAYHEIPKDFAGRVHYVVRCDEPGRLPDQAAAQHAVHPDNSSWIFHGVTLNSMFWPARRQETLLTTAVYNFHSGSRARISTSGTATSTASRTITAPPRSRAAT